MTVLACENLTVSFGRFAAVANVSLALEPERITGLIGPNGAGKTTLVNALSGRVRPTSGRVLLNGRDVTATSVSQRARLGLGRSFQINQIYMDMTVFENLRIAHQAQHPRLQSFWRGIGSWRGLKEKVDASLEEFGLSGIRDTKAAELSHGAQRAVELALTLVNRPSCLLLDEPLAGIGREGIPGMLATIRRVALGRTVVLIEHNMDAVMELCDHIVVLARGAVLASGRPDEIRTNTLVRTSYLGDGDV